MADSFGVQPNSDSSAENLPPPEPLGIKHPLGMRFVIQPKFLTPLGAKPLGAIEASTFLPDSIEGLRPPKPLFRELPVEAGELSGSEEGNQLEVANEPPTASEAEPFPEAVIPEKSVSEQLEESLETAELSETQQSNAASPALTETATGDAIAANSPATPVQKFSSFPLASIAIEAPTEVSSSTTEPIQAAAKSEPEAIATDSSNGAITDIPIQPVQPATDAIATESVQPVTPADSLQLANETLDGENSVAESVTTVNSANLTGTLNETVTNDSLQPANETSVVEVPFVQLAATTVDPVSSTETPDQAIDQSSPDLFNEVLREDAATEIVDPAIAMATLNEAIVTEPTQVVDSPLLDTSGANNSFDATASVTQPFLENSSPSTTPVGMGVDHQRTSSEASSENVFTSDTVAQTSRDSGEDNFEPISEALSTPETVAQRSTAPVPSIESIGQATESPSQATSTSASSHQSKNPFQGIYQRFKDIFSPPKPSDSTDAGAVKPVHSPPHASVTSGESVNASPSASTPIEVSPTSPSAPVQPALAEQTEGSSAFGSWDETQATEVTESEGVQTSEVVEELSDRSDVFELDIENDAAQSPEASTTLTEGLAADSLSPDVELSEAVNLASTPMAVQPFNGAESDLEKFTETESSDRSDRSEPPSNVGNYDPAAIEASVNSEVVDIPSEPNSLAAGEAHAVTPNSIQRKTDLTQHHSEVSSAIAPPETIALENISSFNETSLQSKINSASTDAQVAPAIATTHEASADLEAISISDVTQQATDVTQKEAYSDVKIDSNEVRDTQNSVTNNISLSPIQQAANTNQDLSIREVDSTAATIAVSDSDETSIPLGSTQASDFIPTEAITGFTSIEDSHEDTSTIETTAIAPESASAPPSTTIQRFEVPETDLVESIAAKTTTSKDNQLAVETEVPAINTIDDIQPPTEFAGESIGNTSSNVGGDHTITSSNSVVQQYAESALGLPDDNVYEAEANSLSDSDSNQAQQILESTINTPESDFDKSRDDYIDAVNSPEDHQHQEPTSEIPEDSFNAHNVSDVNDTAVPDISVMQQYAEPTLNSSEVKSDIEIDSLSGSSSESDFNQPQLDLDTVPEVSESSEPDRGGTTIDSTSITETPVIQQYANSALEVTVNAADIEADVNVDSQTDSSFENAGSGAIFDHVTQQQQETENNHHSDFEAVSGDITQQPLEVSSDHASEVELDEGIQPSIDSQIDHQDSQAVFDGVIQQRPETSSTEIPLSVADTSFNPDGDNIDSESATPISDNSAISDSTIQTFNATSPSLESLSIESGFEQTDSAIDDSTSPTDAAVVQPFSAANAPIASLELSSNPDAHLEDQSSRFDLVDNLDQLTAVTQPLPELEGTASVQTSDTVSSTTEANFITDASSEAGSGSLSSSPTIQRFTEPNLPESLAIGSEAILPSSPTPEEPTSAARSLADTASSQQFDISAGETATEVPPVQRSLGLELPASTDDSDSVVSEAASDFLESRSSALEVAESLDTGLEPTSQPELTEPSYDSIPTETAPEVAQPIQQLAETDSTPITSLSSEELSSESISAETAPEVAQPIQQLTETDLTPTTSLSSGEGESVEVSEPESTVISSESIPAELPQPIQRSTGTESFVPTSFTSEPEGTEATTTTDTVAASTQTSTPEPTVAQLLAAGNLPQLPRTVTNLSHQNPLGASRSLTSVADLGGSDSSEAEASFYPEMGANSPIVQAKAATTDPVWHDPVGDTVATQFAREDVPESWSSIEELLGVSDTGTEIDSEVDFEDDSSFISDVNSDESGDTTSDTESSESPRFRAPAVAYTSPIDTFSPQAARSPVVQRATAPVNSGHYEPIQFSFDAPEVEPIDFNIDYSGSSSTDMPIQKKDSPTVSDNSIPQEQPQGFAAAKANVPGQMEYVNNQLITTVENVVENALPKEDKMEQDEGNLETLAREIYSLLRQRLEIERERRNGSPYSGRLPW
ncbi:hypothetical protein ACN4EK_10025 [Pantanalinema rosaneae CENA516]|uniref:hypothetical protein n=1 Tax=Pantanalinema rosaneae TaxID=1620701 RepID=UPI003D6E1C85